jgi:hypothetical protein
MLATPSLGDQQSTTQAVTGLDESEQDDVVDDGADGTVRHEAAETENFRVLVTQERRERALLRERHQAMHELPKSSFVVHRIGNRCQAIQDEPFDVPLLDEPAYLSEQHVDFNLERRDMQCMHPFLSDELTERQSKCVGIAQHLGDVLVRTHDQARPAELARALCHQLVTEDGLACAGVANDEGHRALVYTAPKQCIEPSRADH